MPFSDPIDVNSVSDDFASGAALAALGAPWVTPSSTSPGSAPLNYSNAQQAFQANASDPVNTSVSIGSAQIDPALYTLSYPGPTDMPSLYTYFFETQPDFAASYPTYADLVAYLAANGFTPEQYYAAVGSSFSTLSVTAVPQKVEYYAYIDAGVIPSGDFQGASNPNNVYLGSTLLWATSSNGYTDPGYDGGTTVEVELQTPGFGTFVRVPVSTNVFVRFTNTDGGIGQEYLCEIWNDGNWSAHPADISVTIPYAVQPEIRTGRAWYFADGSGNIRVLQTYVDNYHVDFFPVQEWVNAAPQPPGDTLEGWGYITMRGTPSVPPPPPSLFNNNFADARLVTLTDNEYHDTQDATGFDREISAHEPIVAGADTGLTGWWKFTPEVDGTYQFDTFGSDSTDDTNTDTTLGIYTGTSLADLVQVAGNDDSSSLDPASLGGNSSIEFSVTAGTTYYIQVGAYDATRMPMVYHLNITPPRMWRVLLRDFEGQYPQDYWSGFFNHPVQPAVGTHNEPMGSDVFNGNPMAGASYNGSTAGRTYAYGNSGSYRYLNSGATGSWPGLIPRGAEIRFKPSTHWVDPIYIDQGGVELYVTNVFGPGGLFITAGDGPQTDTGLYADANYPWLELVWLPSGDWHLGVVGGAVIASGNLVGSGQMTIQAGQDVLLDEIYVYFESYYEPFRQAPDPLPPAETYLVSFDDQPLGTYADDRFLNSVFQFDPLTVVANPLGAGNVGGNPGLITGPTGGGTGTYCGIQLGASGGGWAVQRFTTGIDHASFDYLLRTQGAVVNVERDITTVSDVGIGLHYKGNSDGTYTFFSATNSDTPGVFHNTGVQVPLNTWFHVDITYDQVTFAPMLVVSVGATTLLTLTGPAQWGYATRVVAEVARVANDTSNYVDCYVDNFSFHTADVV